MNYFKMFFNSRKNYMNYYTCPMKIFKNCLTFSSISVDFFFIYPTLPCTRELLIIIRFYANFHEFSTSSMKYATFKKCPYKQNPKTINLP